MSSMVNLMKSVILSARTPLSEVSERIDTLYAGGRITADERSGLIELMHSKAAPEAEMGDYRKLYEALAVKVNGLEARMKALEAQADGEGGEAADGYPAWEPWDGVTDEYQTGAVVVHGGKTWESVYDGQNVWEPGAPGVDERYWKEIVGAE